MNEHTPSSERLARNAGPRPARRLRLRNRSGQALGFVAVVVPVTFCMMALSFDLAMLYVAHSEAQRAADSAALAGASGYLDAGVVTPHDAVPTIEDRAREYAFRNHIRNAPLDTPEVAVEPMPDEWKVRVTVRRQGIGLWFAHFLGIRHATVSATAVAEAAPAGVNSCLIPFAIPVPTGEEMALGQEMKLKLADQGYEGVDPYFFAVELPDDPDIVDYCPRARGDTEEAWGRSNVCDICDPQNGRFPAYSHGGWHQSTPVNAWVNGDPNPGGNVFVDPEYAANVCNNNCATVEAGERMTVLTGDRDGPTAWGVNARLARDPKVHWVDEAGGGYLARDGFELEHFDDTYRVVKVATFDPSDIDFSHPSDRHPLITGFAYFFLEQGPQNGFYNPTEQLEIIGRFLFYAPGDGGVGGPFSRYLRLVE